MSRFLEDCLDVRKNLLSLVAAVALLSCFQNQARAQYTQPTVAPNSTLANVRYDYRWELYGGFAYSHFNAGPDLVQGSNLGGYDIQAARFFTPAGPSRRTDADISEPAAQPESLWH